MKFLKVLMIIAMIVFSIYTVGFRLNEMNVEYSEAEYTIQPGDTLWSIAEKNASKHQSIQEYVYQLKQFNNITSNIEVGQVITIFK